MDAGADADAELDRDAHVSRMCARALDLLAIRARSVDEVRRRLLRQGEHAELVEVVIAKLSQAGLLNDADFARQFVRAKLAGAGLSRRRLQQELARRGVARAVADAAIDDVMAEEGVDDGSSIERAARKKFQSLAKQDDQTRRRRTYAYLARRGFDSEDIQRILRELTGA